MSDRPASDYDEYRRTIASCCTDVMLQPPNSIWRHHYYEAGLNYVLATSRKLYSKNVPLNPRPRLNTGVLIANQQCSRHELPSSARSDCSSNSINSFNTPITPSTFPSSSGSPSNDHNFLFTPENSPLNSPVELPAPGSSSFLPPPAAKNTSLCCTICNTPFSGSEQNQATNLRRHRRTMHEQRCELPCPEVDCGKTFTRSDNLKNHRWQVHGLDCPRKVRKRAGRNLGSHPAAT